MEKDCQYESKNYSHGSVVCQSGYEYRCNDGTWDALGTKCDTIIGSVGPLEITIENYMKIDSGLTTSSDIGGDMPVTEAEEFAPFGKYNVDKSKDDWVLTVENTETIRFHVTRDYLPLVDYLLIPSNSLIIKKDQWCHMLLGDTWALMTDADHR